MKARRKSTGGQIAELAPALLILFIVILFPMLDIMYLGLGYCAGWYLNHMTSRACSTVAPLEYPTACTNMNTAWSASSFAGFTGASVVKNQATAVDFKSTAVDRETGEPMKFVEVNTQVLVNPFFSLASVPFLNTLNIDGLTRPITFNYVDKRPQEETGIN
jgi:hypothetical protein